MAETAERLVFGRLPVDRGPYVGGTIYYPYNIVQNAGSTFMAITEGALAEPVADYDSIHDTYTVTEGWRLIAIKGESDATFNTGEEVPDLGITQQIASGTGEDAKLPTSQAVFDYVMKNGVFDLSAYTGNTYESLSAALTALNALGSAFKKGGMSIKFNQVTPIKYSVVKTTGLTTQPDGTQLNSDPGVNSGTYTAAQLSAFNALPATLNSSLTYWMEVAGDTTTYTSWVITYVQSSDNKYVQYRLMVNSFSTTDTDWQGVDEEPTPESDNLVKSKGVNNAIKEIALDNYNKVDSELTQVNYSIMQTGKFGVSSGYRHCYMPVSVGEKYIIKGFSIGTYVFATSNEYSSGGDIPFVEGTSLHNVRGEEDYYNFVVPEGCTWLLLNSTKENNNLWKWNGTIDKQIDVVKESVSNLDSYISMMLSSEIVNYKLDNFGILGNGTYTVDSSYKHTALEVKAGDVFFIHSDSPSDNVRFVFAKSSEYSSGGNIPFADNYNSAFVINAGQTVKVVVPNDDNSIKYILCNAGDRYPCKLYKVENAADYTEKSIEEVEKKLSEVYAEKEIIDLDDIERLPMRNGSFSTGTWTSGADSSGYYKHLIFDVFGDDCLIKITASDESVTSVAFVFNLDLAYTGNEVPFVDGTSAIIIEKGNTEFIPVPKEAVAVLVYIGDSRASYPYKPSSLSIYRNRNVRNTDGIAITAEKLYGYAASEQEETQYYTGYDRNGHSYAVKVRKGDSLNISASFSGTGSTSPQIMGFTDTVPRGGVYIYNSYSDARANYRKNFVSPVDGWFVCLTKAGNHSFEVTSHKSAVAESVALRNSAAFNRYLATLNFEKIDLTSLDKISLSFLGAGIYGGSFSNYRTTFVDVRNALFVKIIANDEYSTRLGFVSSIGTPEPNGIPEYASSSQGAFNIQTGETKIIEVPEDANYMIVYLGTVSNYPFCPAFFGIYKNTQNGSGFNSYEQLVVDFNSRRDRQVSEMLAIGLSPLNPPTDSEGWELPSTLQQLNAQKKSEQLISIKWTPKLNVPSKNSGIFPAGTQVSTGIPYSSNNDDGSKTVGEEVSFHTFMTAIDNPYSLMYTECINNENTWPNSSLPLAPTQKSYWGKVYTMSNNGFAYYGTVCCGFTSSVENAPLKWNNTVIRNYTLTNGIYVPVCPIGTVDFNLLKIGDVCDNTSHSFLIYGLHRDANGAVDKVRIAESSTGIGRGGCRIYTFASREAFEAHVNRSGNPFTVFRYMKLWDNTDYEPSEYVPLISRGETTTVVEYNNAICTFAGDKCTFRETDLVVINYNLYDEQTHQWTKIQVYKDDVLFSEYTLAQAEQSLVDYLSDNNITPNPFNEGLDEHNHALVLGKELKAGMYKACMSDGTNISDYTYWEIISNDITVVENNIDEYEVTVGSKHLIQVIYVNRPGMYYLPTYEEQAAGKFILRPQALSKLFGKSYDGYEVSVKLKGEYGNTTTVPVKIYGDEVDLEDEPETDDN
jgi:hypothetical protein